MAVGNSRGIKLYSASIKEMGSASSSSAAKTKALGGVEAAASSYSRGVAIHMHVDGDMHTSKVREVSTSTISANLSLAYNLSTGFCPDYMLQLPRQQGQGGDEFPYVHVNFPIHGDIIILSKAGLGW